MIPLFWKGTNCLKNCSTGINFPPILLISQKNNWKELFWSLLGWEKICLKVRLSLYLDILKMTLICWTTSSCIYLHAVLLKKTGQHRKKKIKSKKPLVPFGLNSILSFNFLVSRVFALVDFWFIHNRKRLKQDFQHCQRRQAEKYHISFPPPAHLWKKISTKNQVE